MIAENFANRHDFVGLSAFGLNYKNKKTEIDGFDMEFMNKMLNEATGMGRLNQCLYRLCKELDTFIYKIVGMAVKYDI